MSSRLLSRIGRESLKKKVIPAAETVKFFSNEMSMGWSGFTPAGYPKAVPTALADHVEKNDIHMQFELFIGASAGMETEDRWAGLNMIKRRLPYQTGKNIAKGINDGSIAFADHHLGMFPQNMQYGFITKDHDTNRGKLDYAILEATDILPNGGIVPGTGVGAAPEFAELAEKIIVEINTAIPSLHGLHDLCTLPAPPNRESIPVRCVEEIGRASCRERV